MLKQLFQLIFDTSVIPTVWRKSVICPILKDPQSDKRVPLNYRGISLLSCVNKLYSSFLNKRITVYLNNNNILADEQNGFRADRSCVDHVFTLDSITRNSNNIYSAFIDLRKAFDFVDRDMMLYKLLMNGIDGKVYNSIKSIYSNTISAVRLGNKLTEWFDCSTGVKQGDSLSPTIFAIFVNDLVDEIRDLDLGVKVDHTSISMLLYADDIVFIAESEDNLQVMLDKMHEWCKKWRVLVNTDKSKIVHFRHGRSSRTNFEFSIGRNKLEIVSTYKYLGVFMNEKGDYSLNAETLSKGAGRALGGLISKIHNFKQCGFKTYEKLYQSCIIPILDYSSAVWGYSTYQSTDNVQNRAIRYFLGVHRFAPTAAIVGESGWLPCVYRRWTNILWYWNRLITLDDQRITKIAFRHDYIHSFDKKNWCSKVLSIMTRLNISEHFYNVTPIDMDTVKHLMYAHYSNIWLQDCAQSAKLRTYRMFKSQFSREDYLHFNLSRSERALYAQFRCGILPLRIETGRFVSEPPEQRLCVMCDTNSVEDECHFLINCPKYNTIRDKLFNNAMHDTSFVHLSNTEKLIYLIRSGERKVIKFVAEAFSLRRRIIYK